MRGLELGHPWSSTTWGHLDHQGNQARTRSGWGGSKWMPIIWSRPKIIMFYIICLYWLLGKGWKSMGHHPKKCLVGGWPTPLKNMTSSVGIMNFPTEWKVIKFMFQTTNQKLSALESLEIMTHTGKYWRWNEPSMHAMSPYLWNRDLQQGSKNRTLHQNWKAMAMTKWKGP